MTSDTNFELNGPGFRFENLPAEVLSSVKYTRELIAGCGDTELIEQSVTSLNKELSTLGLIGKDAKLRSDDVIVTEQSIDPEDRRLKPVLDSDILSLNSFDGTFLGCSATELGFGPDLVYVVEMPLDENSLHYRTAVAPVDSAKLELESAPKFMTTQEGEDLASYLIELSTIRDPEFQNDLKDLIEVFEDYDSIEPAFLRSLGEVVTHMFANPFVGMDEEARMAVGRIIDTCFDKEVTYRIYGDALEVDEVKGGSKLGVKSVLMDGHYEGVGASMDYLRVKGKEGGGIVPVESSQPVIMIRDKSGELYRIPLKYIRECENVTPISCDEFRARFIEDLGNGHS